MTARPQFRPRLYAAGVNVLNALDPFRMNPLPCLPALEVVGGAEGPPPINSSGYPPRGADIGGGEARPWRTAHSGLTFVSSRNMGNHALRPDQRPVLQSEQRERLGRLLGQAFPLGDDGSFAGLLQAIREHQPDRR